VLVCASASGEPVRLFNQAHLLQQVLVLDQAQLMLEGAVALLARVVEQEQASLKEDPARLLALEQVVAQQMSTIKVVVPQDRDQVQVKAPPPEVHLALLQLDRGQVVEARLLTGQGPLVARGQALVQVVPPAISNAR